MIGHADALRRPRSGSSQDEFTSNVKWARNFRAQPAN